MARLPVAAAALLLAACAQQARVAAPPPAASTAPPPPKARPAPVAACNAAPAQYAVGRTQTATLVEEVRQKSGSTMARVLRPNQVVTMEFNGQRVNVVVDAGNKVTAVRCG